LYVGHICAIIRSLNIYRCDAYPELYLLFLMVHIAWTQATHTTVWITNSRELSPSWEVASCMATQELPDILWNLKVHYHDHKSPPLVPILSQINPVHTIPSYLRHTLILSTHLSLGLPNGLLPSSLPTNILYAFLFSPMCARSTACLNLLHLIILIMFAEEYKL
jgi:hypothetical protein